MAAEAAGTYLFENGKFLPHTITESGNQAWSEYLATQGYGDQEQTFGSYPDVYIKVYEAQAVAQAEFLFAATVNLVFRPHHVLIRDLNGLIALLNLLTPIFGLAHSRPDDDLGDALFGSQGAQEESA